MYNIIQLNDMDLSELQSVAKELGINKFESMKKDELVYSILDEQAIANASKRTANKEKAANKEKENQPRKRSRISVKKEGDKVYTATQDKAQKLEANTPEIPDALHISWHWRRQMRSTPAVKRYAMNSEVSPRM